MTRPVTGLTACDQLGWPLRNEPPPGTVAATNTSAGHVRRRPPECGSLWSAGGSGPAEPTRGVQPSAFRVLRTLARLVASVFFALHLARVAGDVARLLQCRPVLRVGQDQGAGDAVAYRSGLGGHAAAIHVRRHV